MTVDHSARMRYGLVIGQEQDDGQCDGFSGDTGGAVSHLDGAIWVLC